MIAGLIIRMILILFVDVTSEGTFKGLKSDDSFDVLESTGSVRECKLSITINYCHQLATTFIHTIISSTVTQNLEHISISVEFHRKIIR